VFFVCFVRIIQKLVVELRNTEKKFEKKKIEKKQIRKKKHFVRKKVSQNVFLINWGSGEHEKKFLEVETERERSKT
jgi:hypothetical protein